MSPNISVGQLWYCYLFNIVYRLVCKLKNCKAKHASRDDRSCLPSWYMFGIVRSARNKIDKLATICKCRSFGYLESCIVGLTETWRQHNNAGRTVNLEVGWIEFDVDESQGNGPHHSPMLAENILTVIYICNWGKETLQDW